MIWVVLLIGGCCFGCAMWLVIVLGLLLVICAVLIVLIYTCFNGCCVLRILG